MARKVEQMPEQAGTSRYDWAEWLDGSVWELEPGIDFKGKVATFRSMATAQAKRRGGRIKTRHIRGGQADTEQGDKLYVQFVPDAEAPQQQTQMAAVQ